MDLGQQKCINTFDDDFKTWHWTPGNLSFILAGTSQGTATILNWLGQKPHAEQEEIACALFLESVLGSGNSGIMHTVGMVPGATYLPFSRAWIPLAAKALHPHYKPWGMQAMESASNISPNIPVIIMHHVLDKQTCIDDARRVYCQLKKTGNENVYLFEIEGTSARSWDTIRHIDVIDFDENKNEKVRDIQFIFQKHGIEVTRPKLEERDISAYQPSIEEVEKRIAANSGRKNFIRNIIDCSAGIALVAGVSYLAKQYFTQRCFA